MKFNERYKEILNEIDNKEGWGKKAGRAIGTVALVTGVTLGGYKAGEKVAKTAIKKAESAAKAADTSEEKIKARDKFLAGKGPNPDDKVKKEK